jgi:hypothetical protein
MTVAAEQMERHTVVLVVDVMMVAATRNKMDAIGLAKAVLRHVTAMAFAKKEKIVTTARTTVDPRIIILVMAVSAALVELRFVEIAVAAPSLLARNGAVLKVSQQPLITRAI